jgi:hypothetical protein
MLTIGLMRKYKATVICFRETGIHDYSSSLEWLKLGGQPRSAQVCILRNTLSHFQCGLLHCADAVAATMGDSRV